MELPVKWRLCAAAIGGLFPRGYLGLCVGHPALDLTPILGGLVMVVTPSPSHIQCGTVLLWRATPDSV